MAARFYVLVTGQRTAAVKTIMRWARALLPAAVLLSAPGELPAGIDEEDAVVISVDADDVPSGPLSLADAIARRRAGSADAGHGSRAQPAGGRR